MAKHIFQYTIKPSENTLDNIYTCNYRVAFLIVNLFMVMYITQQLNKLTKRRCNVVTTFDIHRLTFNIKKKTSLLNILQICVQFA